MKLEPFQGRTSKDEALVLLGTLLRQPCWYSDKRTLKAAETAARLLLGQGLNENERRAAQSLWTMLAEARRYPREGRRAQALTQRVVRHHLAEISDSTAAA